MNSDMESAHRRFRLSLPMTPEAGLMIMVAATGTFAASDSVVKAIGSSVPLLAGADFRSMVPLAQGPSPAGNGSG